jgi:hypothetical protein
MYKLTYYYDSSVNDVSLLREERFKFFVFNNDSLFGQIYDPGTYHVIPEGRENVDSVLKTHIFENPKYDSLVDKKPDSTFNEANGDVGKTYNYPATQEYPGRTTGYFYFSNRMKDINTTFARKLDKAFGKKLVKVKLVMHPFYWEENKVNFPERISIMEMKEIPIENREEIMTYFKKYDSARSLR